MAHLGTNGMTYNGRTLIEIDAFIRAGWGAQLGAADMAAELGVVLGFIGQRVSELGLPARDHQRRPLRKTVSTRMPDLTQPVDEEGE